MTLRRTGDLLFSYPLPEAAIPEDDGRALLPRDGGARGASVLGREPCVRGPGGSCPREVLLPVDVPLPQRKAAHGARQELHHRRRDQPVPAHARAQRAPADGMGRLRPAGGERGDAEPGAARALDLPQHRVHEGAAPAARVRLRLEPRARDLPARVLPLGAVAVHPPVRAGDRLPSGIGGELGPGRSDGARQRAGHRRARLALRRRGRAAQDPAVVPAHHRLRRRIAHRARPHRLARAGQDDAAQLDRALRRHGDRLRDRNPRSGRW